MLEAYESVLHTHGLDPASDSECYKQLMRIDRKQQRQGRSVYEIVNAEIELAYKSARAIDHKRSVLLSKSFLALVQNMVHRTVVDPGSRNQANLLKKPVIRSDRQPGAKFRTMAINRYDSSKENVLRHPSGSSSNASKYTQKRSKSRGKGSRERKSVPAEGDT